MTRGEAAATLFVVVAGAILIYKGTEPGRQKEARRNCFTNLSQIGLGISLYVQDNSDTFPRAWFGKDAGPSDANSKYKWMDVIFPYVKKEDIFNCPSDSTSKPYHYRSTTSYGSYVINNAYSAAGDAQTPPVGIQQSRVSLPNDTVLVMDGENNFQCSWPDAEHTPSILGDNPYHFDSARGRHGRGIYLSGTALDCGGLNSSSVQDFMRRTQLISGTKIYTAFTVEAD